MIDPIDPDYTNTPISDKRARFEYIRKNGSFVPIVSIITPFYNTGSIFHETAQSILQQSYQQWEWLIINDGSTDPVSLGILSQYRAYDPRIVVIDHDVNKGPGAARNTGFARAASEYVLQVDSDDLIEPTTVEKWLWHLFSYPECSFVNGYQVAFHHKTYLWKRGFGDGKTILRENVVDNTFMTRKSVYLSVKGHDESIVDGLEDWDFWLRCADSGHWGNTISEFLTWYRVRPHQKERWGNMRPEKMAEFLSDARNKYPGLWKGKFPKVAREMDVSNEPISASVPFQNALHKSKPRLLFIVPWFSVGGADKYNIDLIRQLTKRGWEVTITTSLQSSDTWAHEFARLTPDIFMLHRFLKFCDYPRFIRYLIESRQPDVVAISNSEFGYLLAPFLRAYCPEPAYIDIMHSEDDTWMDGGFPGLSVKYREYLDLSIVVSKYLKNWMLMRGGEDKRIEVCYVNIDPSFWNSDDPARERTRSALGGSADKPLILYPARLDIGKQPRVFAEVIRKLKREGLAFVAVVAGDGDERRWLERYIRRHGLSECIRMLGSIPISQMKVVMAASDILFLPSQREGISLAIFEAMSCGLCVVSADVGGQKELVTPETGILLPRGSVDEEIRNYRSVLAALLRDHGTRKQMGARAKARIREYFTLELMGTRMAELMNRAMQMKRDDPRPIIPRAAGLREAEKAIAYLGLIGKENVGHSSLNMSIGTRVYFGLSEMFGFLYLLGIRRGWSWVIPIKNRLRRILKVGDIA